MARDSREVILDAASDLFNREDIHTVGIDAIVAHAGVGKATVYRHFRSKDDIFCAFLQRRDRRVRERLDERENDPSLTPLERVVGIFEDLEAWCSAPEFRGSAFSGAAVGFKDRDHPVREIVSAHIEHLSAWLRRQLEAAGLRSAQMLARQLLILLEGAVDVALMENDPAAATDARLAAQSLLAGAA